MSLSPGVKSAIESAKRAAVEYQMSRIRDFWGGDRWLSARNRYGSETVKRIEDEIAAGGIRSPGQLAQYIAASSVLHAMDGWTYLGKAISSHVGGDSDTARHLAYYAELRAAMALLASVGVGVFERRHFVLGSNRRATHVGGAPGTHVFAWEALDHWISLNHASDSLFSWLKPAGRPMLQWLQAFSATPASTGLLAKSWIETWGLDLQRLVGDRQARNISSYRPTELHFEGVRKPKEAVKFAADLWELAETRGEGSFLDAYLLRQGIEQKFKASHPHGRTSKQAKKLFQSQVRSMVHTVGVSTLGGFDWEAFLVRKILPRDPAVLAEAAGTLKPCQLGYDAQVISRAFLLLHIASASSNALLRHSDMEQAELSFWTSPLCSRLGVCRSELPAERRDLWADVSPSLDALKLWVETSDDSDSCTFDLNRACGVDLKVVASTEAVGVWALGV